MPAAGADLYAPDQARRPWVGTDGDVARREDGGIGRCAAIKVDDDAAEASTPKGPDGGSRGLFLGAPLAAMARELGARGANVRADTAPAPGSFRV